MASWIGPQFVSPRAQACISCKRLLSVHSVAGFQQFMCCFLHIEFDTRSVVLRIEQLWELAVGVSCAYLRLRKGTNAVSANGVSVNCALFDRETFSPKTHQGMPFSQCGKIQYLCNGPISVDPICSQPEVGRGNDMVGNPYRAQTSQFELFELILLLTLDKQFPVERLEATGSQSTVPSPLFKRLSSSRSLRAGTSFMSHACVLQTWRIM